MHTLSLIFALSLAIVALPHSTATNADPVCFTGVDGEAHCCALPPTCAIFGSCPMPATLSCVAHAVLP